MKRAIIVGVNDYPGTNMDLAGCVNDADDWTTLLVGRGAEATILTDTQATRDGILSTLARAVSALEKGDTLFFTYSGHGTYAADDDSDEPDKRDEGICPYDVMTEGPVLDDELNALFAARARGSQIVLIADSCFSGTLARGALLTRRTARFMPPSVGYRQRRSMAPIKEQAGVSLSGCRDHEVSYDACFGGRSNGAFTYWAVRTFKGCLTYNQWMAEIRKHLPCKDYPQTPQIGGSMLERNRPALGVVPGPC
jgi:hypothetical protein